MESCIEASHKHKDVVCMFSIHGNYVYWKDVNKPVWIPFFIILNFFFNLWYFEIIVIVLDNDSTERQTVILPSCHSFIYKTFCCLWKKLSSAYCMKFGCLSTWAILYTSILMHLSGLKDVWHCVYLMGFPFHVF